VSVNVNVVVLTPDLMFYSRVAGPAESAGFTPEQAAGASDFDGEASVAVVELRIGMKDEDLRAIREKFAGARVYGFGPHTQKDLLQAARAAGFDFVGLRSDLHRLAELLAVAAPPS
jgi:hypothetical protein